MCGRTDLEWNELTDAVIGFLAERARAGALTTYTAVNNELMLRTGHAPFDFGTDKDRAAMGQLLGTAVELTYAEVGAMVSAIVTYVDGNDPGPGFFRLAEQKGVLRRGATADERDAFWTREVAALHGHYSRGR
jgi:hypothetical protein